MQYMPLPVSQFEIGTLFCIFLQGPKYERCKRLEGRDEEKLKRCFFTERGGSIFRIYSRKSKTNHILSTTKKSN